MLGEYVGSGDVAEVERELRALALPFFHHEVVKQAILIATDDMKHAKVCAAAPLLARTYYGPLTACSGARDCFYAFPC